MDARQTPAIPKCTLSYLRYFLGYVDSLQAATAHECVASYLCQSLRQLDARQTRAALECACFYLRYFLGDADFLQAATVCECYSSYLCQSLRQLDARQARVHRECALSYFCYSLGYIDFRQDIALGECLISYLFHCFRQLNARQLLAADECFLSYTCYPFGKYHLLKGGICVLSRAAKSLRYGCRPACGDVEVADLEVFNIISISFHLLFQIHQVLVVNLPHNHYPDGVALAGACQCSLQCRPICQQASRCFVLHRYEVSCLRRLHQCRALPSGGRYAQCAHPCFVYFQVQLVAGIGLGGDVIGG